MAILGDERPSWRPQSYGYALDGYRLSLEFPTVKLLDYQERFISRVEEMAKEEGRQQGRQQGTQEATKRTLREDALAILQVRFNAVPPEVADALNGIDDPKSRRRKWNLCPKTAIFPLSYLG